MTKALQFKVTGNLYKRNGQVAKKRYLMAAFRTATDAQAYVRSVTASTPGNCGPNHGIRVEYPR